ncbi:hypothetical protein HPULCUR_011060 [Helicostylum pulchrum]|uniref:Uncharacterized protein n=1 Tax=Helicostylum pulchrum TaxID=562976 RepID=A0ABP9YF16_9FUNG
MFYGHRAVNHEEGYVNSEGTHTNTIEGTWNGVKIRCFPRSRTKKNMPRVLLEFILRRKYFGDLFGGMMKSLREVNFVPGDRQNSVYTEYGNVESDVEDDLPDYSSDEEDGEEENDDDDDDYRPYPPSYTVVT